ncbi:sigma-B regulation protein RsbU (phosphoserine phosphatase) [Desulfonauticus submarinus]|uniref:Sigma-B regulation protein RsbU (Phosphoserine phosphatase) n=1 Tax=Desulfonauticus submarinus TaxID=206665 RepID=A0A1G9ZW48_9BACT|nr:SpoIIE family protein phosphatase [Desulfonauticus submarinus]SDN25639.1 sigma-B regulation protein RsbU (phosphoserine phosphatase) [Desulfonauticus submarinus]
MRDKIISLKWKIVFPLVILFVIMAAIIVFLSSDMTSRAMFNLSEEQANNVLYLVNININSMYKNLLSSKIETILNTKKIIRFMNQDIYNYLSTNGYKKNSFKNIEYEVFNKYEIIGDYNIFSFIMKDNHLVYSSNKKIDFIKISNIQDLKGRKIIDIFHDINTHRKSEFIIFKYNNRFVVGFIKFYDSKYIISVFIDCDDIIKEIEKQKNIMISNIVQNMAKINIAKSGYLYILNDEGNVIFPLSSIKSYNNFKFKIKPFILANIKKNEGVNKFNFIVKSDKINKYYITSIFFKPLKWYVGAVIPIKEIVSPGKKLVKIQALVVLLVFFISLVFIIMFISRVTNPIKKLAEFTSVVATHDFTKGEIELSDTLILNKKRKDEIGLLTESFIKMHKELASNIKRLLTVTANQERLESELRIARQIQMGILPSPEPKPPLLDLDFHAYLKPAREVGGDLFHYFFIDDERICFAVGDVSDKGVPAAFFMAMTMTLLKNTAMSGGSIGEIVSRVNNELAQNNPNNMFVTLFVGILNVKTGYLEYTNAGHNPTLYIPYKGRAVFLREISGPVVGAMEGLKYKTFYLQLYPKDLLFLYTDGVTEAMDINKNLYGEDRLYNLLVENSKALYSNDIINIVCNDLKDFVGKAEQSDDITMMVLRWDKETN